MENDSPNNNNSIDDSVPDSQKRFLPIYNDDQKESFQKEPEGNSSLEEVVSISVESDRNRSAINNRINLSSGKTLYEEYKKKLMESQNNMREAIKSIEEWVKLGENQRNYKMKSEFEREKEYKLEEQSEIKSRIEELSKNNINEKLINHFNAKISQQGNLYNKYDEMKDEVSAKIQKLKQELPELEQKVKQSNERLKVLNKGNLTLMDKLNDLKNELNYNNNNISTNMNNSQSGNNSSVILNNSQMNNNQSTGILNNSDKLQGSININEIVEENEDIKNQYNRILELKKMYKNKKIENEHLTKKINEMNTDCFLFKKIFCEGMHEIAKEMLKIHELKLDKVISGSSNNANSLYFEIVKGNVNGNNTKNDDVLKLPLITKNIMQKYNYPIVEKSNPDSLIYKVLKKILDENQNQSKLTNIKKNKIKWEDFQKLSAYQMYTVLNMNKDIIKKIESNIFPRKIIFSGGMSQKEEDSFNFKGDCELNDINEINEMNDEIY